MKSLRMLWIISITVLLSGNSCNNQEKRNTSEYISKLHNKILTVDSHTDTPLRFIRKGFDFAERQDSLGKSSKIDIPRMKEGKLDGLFMAVFVGQGERTEEGYVRSKEQAYRIFDSIYSVIDKNNTDLALSLTPRQFKKNSRRNRHSVFIGIENGYPIGRDISLIDTFFNLGARYITLCHTSNNDICDSSTDQDGEEFGGLSEFGKEAVQRMNELGMMIDVSHASDKSFYDIIAATTLPVIASHSCARALCDNPRNMDDEMLRALAVNGGVIQMCILSEYVKTPANFPERDSAKNAVYDKHGDYYSLDEKGKQAFLKDWYNVDDLFPLDLANVSDVVNHIDHIVKIAGIDHVGIGTDFDGGGGLEGCMDVSQIENITAELVRRGYDNKEIEKIWSGNLMRVMKRNLR